MLAALLLLCLFIGAALGMYFAVWSLLPVVGIALLLATFGAIVLPHSFGAVIITTIASVVLLQFGYLVGILSRQNVAE